MSITGEEYEKLLAFSSFINKDYERFTHNVSYGLNQFFQFPLTVYTVFRRDCEGDVYIDQIEGHSIYPDGLKAYRDEYWKSDLFVQRINPSQQGRMQNNVITISDIATYDEFYATAYGKYLLEINTPYQATLRAIRKNSYPLHVLCIFKTREQGEFTQHERELLAKVGQIFSEGVDHYLRFLSDCFFQNFLQDEVSAARHNLAIIDENSDIVFSSSSFARLSLECFGIQSRNGLIHILKQLFWEHLHINFFAITTPVTLHIRDFDITVSEHCYTWPQHLGQFHFVSIERADPPAASLTAPQETAGDCIQQRLMEKYHFTPREAEVAQLLTAGMSNRQLAESLYISLPTVKFHIQNICKKIDVASRASAIAKLLNDQKREP